MDIFFTKFFMFVQVILDLQRLWRQMIWHLLYVAFPLAKGCYLTQHIILNSTHFCILNLILVWDYLPGYRSTSSKEENYWRQVIWDIYLADIGGFIFKPEELINYPMSKIDDITLNIEKVTNKPLIFFFLMFVLRCHLKWHCNTHLHIATCLFMYT